MALGDESSQEAIAVTSATGVIASALYQATSPGILSGETGTIVGGLYMLAHEGGQPLVNWTMYPRTALWVRRAGLTISSTRGEGWPPPGRGRWGGLARRATRRGRASGTTRRTGSATASPARCTRAPSWRKRTSPSVRDPSAAINNARAR